MSELYPALRGSGFAPADGCCSKPGGNETISFEARPRMHLLESRTCSEVAFWKGGGAWMGVTLGRLRTSSAAASVTDDDPTSLEDFRRASLPVGNPTRKPSQAAKTSLEPQGRRRMKPKASSDSL